MLGYLGGHSTSYPVSKATKTPATTKSYRSEFKAKGSLPEIHIDSNFELPFVKNGNQTEHQR